MFRRFEALGIGGPGAALASDLPDPERAHPFQQAGVSMLQLSVPRYSKTLAEAGAFLEQYAAMKAKLGT